MSAIAALLTASPGRSPRIVDSLLDRMRHRGDTEAGRVELGRGALGGVRYEWETDAGIAPAILVRQAGRVAVVADASLYYRDDLRRALGDSSPGDDAAALILAAYARWGERLTDHLEGDYAFVILDADRDLLLAARDHVGRRPLHYSRNADGVMLASLARAVAIESHAPFHLPAIAAAIGGLLGGSLETGFEGVYPVPAGATVAFTRSRMRVVRAWEAPRFRISGKPRLVESAAELRALLADAVRERVVEPTTAVWLSGGADSTAVFGAGQSVPGTGAMLRPVSISYPEGDSARENDYIAATAGRWNAPVTWIDSESVELFDELETRVAVRDDPYAHSFEAMNFRLASTSRGLGARAAFDGYGGDQLFHVSAVFLADWFVRLQWRELREARREMELSGFRSLVARSMLPWFPDGVRETLDRIRGRDPGRGTLIRQSMASWLEPAWSDDPRTATRALSEPPRRWLESPSAYESRWYVETPYFPRAAAWAAGLALQAGISIRSPLLDLRVLRFAASRPLSERASPRDTKLVLKEAMRGLIPDAVLAPREAKTGVPRGYLARQLRRGFRALFQSVLDDRCRLAELGIVRERALRQACDEWEKNPVHLTGVQLLLTLQAELWVRSCESQGTPSRTVRR